MITKFPLYLKLSNFPILSRGVPEVTLAGFCLKFARYALYMWLPLFLTNHLNYSFMEAGIISAAFDIGGAVRIFKSMCTQFLNDSETDF